MLQRIRLSVALLVLLGVTGCGFGGGVEVAVTSDDGTTADAAAAGAVPGTEGGAEQYGDPTEGDPAGEGAGYEYGAPDGESPDGEAAPGVPPGEEYPAEGYVPDYAVPGEPGDAAGDYPPAAGEEYPAEGTPEAGEDYSLPPGEEAPDGEAVPGIPGNEAIPGAPGEIPGAEGDAGAEGVPGGEGEEGGASDFPEGSPEAALKNFALLIAEGDPEEAKLLIGKRATGPLKLLRDGKLSEEKFADLKEALSKVQYVGSRSISGGTFVVLQNADGRMIQIKLGREGGDWVVSELKVGPARPVQPRFDQQYQQ